MKTVFIFLILYLSSPSAYSLVNLRNGSYTEKWIDFIEPEVGIDMRIERFYSSRSLFTGLFGFGWCSVFETHLSKVSDGTLRLTECGGGLDITYYPLKFDLQSPEKTVNTIIERLKIKNKYSKENLAVLRKQLKFSTHIRFEYAKKMSLLNPKKIKAGRNTFLAKSKGMEKISFNGQVYKRERHGKPIQVFDLKGRLIEQIYPSGHKLMISYRQQNRIHQITDKNRRLTFFYDKSGRLSKIKNGNGLQALYHFEGENLVRVTNMWSKTYRYSYDKNHNLTQVSFPDNTFMKMSYNSQRDWVVRYINRKKCQEDYRYLLMKNNPNNYVSFFDRKCLKKDGSFSPQQKGKQEFWYKNYRLSSQKYLYRFHEKYKKDFTDIIFHPYIGRPVSVKKDKLRSQFQYFANGLINLRDEQILPSSQQKFKWNKYQYTYNPKSFQVIAIHEKDLNSKGQIIKQTKTNYQYNSFNLIRQASTDKGQKVYLKYDQTGKLDRMIDHKKNELKITYKVGVEKPVEIEQVKKGKVKITYDSSGEVASVESLVGNNKTSVGVVEKFIDMVSLLGPLGQNLKI